MKLEPEEARDAIDSQEVENQWHPLVPLRDRLQALFVHRYVLVETH